MGKRCRTGAAARRRAVLAVLTGLGLWAGVSGRAAGQAPPPPAGGPQAGDSITPLGPRLFPLYDHHLRTADNTEVLTVLFPFYHSTSSPSGNQSRLIFPLYYWQRHLAPPDRRLYLFPLLFFHRSSEEESFDHALPFFYSSRTAQSAFQILFPFWWHTADLVRKSSIHRALFPLLKVETVGEEPVAAHRIRFGLRWILSIFEARSSEGLARYAGFNFFNWKRETDGGLALFRHERSQAADGVVEERTLFFPFYWRSNRPDHSYLVGGPFYGYFAGGGAVREYYTPLVWRGAGEGDFKSLFLFPFYHRTTRAQPQLSYIASYPFFQYRRTAEERRWGILFGFLYGNQKNLASGKTTHQVLYPLGYFDVEPDGLKGHQRLLPFYFDSFNSERRFRFSFPLYWNYQTRSGREWTWDFSLFLPTYLGWGAPQDYFATGFPLYWSSTTGARAWQLLIPAFIRQHDATSSALYSFPFTSIDYPSQKILSFLAGGATYRRYYDLRKTDGGWAVDLFWWLWEVERRPEAFRYRFLPLFSMAREGQDRSLLLFPLLYTQWSPSERSIYFFPAYGRFRSSDGLVEKDFYALGTYATTRRDGPGGEPLLRRRDILWSSISFQTDLEHHLVHRRVLPAGFWQTRSVNEDRTLLVPFYYSHRIQLEDETHHLSLVLGNLFLSKSLERDQPATATAAAVPPASPAATAPPAGAPGTATTLVREQVSHERGILWPITRWGQDAQGNPFQWALPFYYHSRTPTEENRSFFPFVYQKTESGGYHVGYFRYFFLSDLERFEGGHRFSLGQLVVDWMSDQARREKRFRFLYPIIEARTSPEGYGFQITPLFQGEKREQGGELRNSAFLFPFFFKGSTQLKKPDGGYTVDARHFYLFPLFGVSKKSLRTEYDFLIPFCHLRRSLEGFALHLRPVFFLRNDPEEFSVRVWPLHSHESGESSGEWWVTRYLYLSKLALRSQSFSYQLDPYLFHAGRSPAETSAGGLLGLVNYQRAGAETSFRALPLARGYSRPEESGLWLLAFLYGRDFGKKPIDYAVPWRFFFVANRLRGNGERHLSVLWKLTEYTDNPERPLFHEFRMMQELVVDRRSEQSRELALNPIFNYYRDDERRLVDWSVALSAYHYRRTEGLARHTLFWFIRW